MATTIKLKNGSGAPLAGDLVAGEPALDLTNKRLYTEDSGGTVIEVGTNPTSLTTGTFTSTGIDDNATSTAITIDASENVGIGNTTPNSYSFDTGPALVIGSGSNNPHLSVLSSTTGTGYLSFADGTTGNQMFRGLIEYAHSTDHMGFRTAGTERMRIDSSGRVGIGTTSPSFPLAGQLHISGGTGYVGLNLQKGSAGTGHLLEFTDENNTLQYRIGTNFASGGQNLLFAYGSTPTIGMTLSSSGNVGIGITPSYTLDIQAIASSFNPVRFSGHGSSIDAFLYTDTAYWSIGDTAAYGGNLWGGNKTSNFVHAYTNGSERMRIDSSGDLLLGGTTSYTSFLSSSTGNLQVNGGIIGEPGSGNPFQIANYRSSPIAFLTSGNIERMRIDSSGNLQIGSTTADGRLKISAASGSAVAAELTLWGNNGSAFGSTNIAKSKIDSVTDGTAYGSNMRFYTNDTSNNYQERMRIDSSGNVGIGTASAGNLLHIHEGSSAGAWAQFTNTTTSAGGSSGVLVGLDSNEDFRVLQYEAKAVAFYTSATERMRINSSGNVGIGTSSPTNNLDVGFADLGSGSIGFRSSTYSQIAKIVGSHDSGTAEGSLRFHTRSGGSEPERMRINSSGRLLVGQTSGSFHILNSNNANNYAAGVTNSSSTNPYGLNIYLATTNGAGNSFLVCSDNANRCFIRGDGDLENVNNSYGAISDERVKSNIVNASSQIDDIMAVQVRSYTLNETGETHIGVVAQELEASGMSGLVQEDEEGMKSVKYSILYMKAIKALQEAVTRIETLEAEVAALKGA